MKSCRVCGNDFAPWSGTQAVCGLKCSLRIAPLNRRAERAEKAAHKRKLAALKTRAEWMKDAQAAVNAFVRARDAELPCVSCGRHHDGQWHAGHYLSTGARPELRFDERNIHKQCQPCNTHLHGNLALYRVELIRRIGLEAVEQLEGPHLPRKYTIDELKAIRDEYRSKLKALDTKPRR